MLYTGCRNLHLSSLSWPVLEPPFILRARQGPCQPLSELLPIVNDQLFSILLLATMSDLEDDYGSLKETSFNLDTERLIGTEGE